MASTGTVLGVVALSKEDYRPEGEIRFTRLMRKAHYVLLVVGRRLTAGLYCTSLVR